MDTGALKSATMAQQRNLFSFFKKSPEATPKESNVTSNLRNLHSMRQPQFLESDLQQISKGTVKSEYSEERSSLTCESPSPR